jgi:membrane protein DedA with SNARE-associated domain
MLHAIVEWLVQTIGQLGYSGICILMFLESTFFPFPSEVVIPPAGYLASQDSMNLWAVIGTGTLGSLLGALFNYWLALRFGRPLFEKLGSFVLVSARTLDKADLFFDRHGHISTFIARLIPGIRQVISLPAGLARMRLDLFCLFTSLGAGIWVVILALMGYWFGNNQELVAEKLHQILLILAPVCLAVIFLYIRQHRKKNGR